MYLRKKLITALRVKNVLLFLFCAFEFAVSTTYIISEFSTYRDNPEYAWEAVSMKSSIIMTCVAIVLLVIALISSKQVGSAVFFSSYFEGDLDGYTTFSDLAKVTGKSESAVRRQLHLYRRLYMKDFEFKNTGSGEIVELYSKKCLCECRSCGAHIEKRIYFTGECPYCHSSDLHARVLMGEHFYSVSNELDSGRGRPEFYKSGSLETRKMLYLIVFAVGLLFALILFFYTISEASHYFDQEYHKKILFDPSKHLSSFKLIKQDILENIIYGSITFIALALLSEMCRKKTMAMFAASIWANFFSKAEKPFISAAELSDPNFTLGEKGKLRKLRRTIRNGYLKSCTLEVHDGILMVALAKKTVKDRCLYCGAPLVGVTDENDRCRYCGNLIMGILEKR